MPVEHSLLCLFFLVVLASVVPRSWATVEEHEDEYWQKREEEAKKIARDAYHSNPEEVNDHINHHVHLALLQASNNSSRRSLRTNKGVPCLATNPIDRCWRCNPKWAKQRKKLSKCVLGFGRKTIGGKYGRIYVVTDPSDNDLVELKPGTLRYAVTRTEPLWIIFARSMVIKLKGELIMTSYKTIDGRGAHVIINRGAGITIQFVQHVIIHGIRIRDIVGGSGGMIRDSEEHYGLRNVADGDAITIYGSSNIWIDRVSLSHALDGLIDVTQGSTAITISNNHMTRHNKVMLMGGDDDYKADEIMQVTVAFNHFGKGLVQRMPRCRYGFIHVLNNDYKHWLMYAIGGSQHPTIISQGNRYVAPHNNNAKQITKREIVPESEWMKWTWRSQGDLMENGAYFLESGKPNPNIPYSKKDVISAKPGSFVTRLTRFAGALTCNVGQPC